MRSVIYTVIFLCFLGMPSLAFADNDSDDDISESTCLSFDSGGSGGSSADYRAEMGNDTLERKEILEKLIKKMKTFFNKEDKDSYAYRYGLSGLKESQKLWLAYKESHCTLEFHQGGGGTVSANFGSACDCKLISRRISDLKSILLNYGYSEKTIP